MEESIYDIEFIHLGNNKLYDINPVSNYSGFMNKPLGGLWASKYRLDDFGHRSNWERFAYATEMHFYRECDYFKFKIKRSSNILVIDSLEDLKNADRELFKSMDVKGNNYLYLDFELISSLYDAFYLTEDGELQLSHIGPEHGYVPFNYWDCDSLIVFNKNAIKITEKGEED